MSESRVKLLQQMLRDAGFSPGPIDGVFGPATEKALRELVTTYNRLRNNVGRPLASDSDPLPWMALAKRLLWLHEVRDNAKVRQFLESDGSTVGDPAKVPWCGDFVETVIKKSIPTEPFPKPLADNPYWARNWVHFGVPCPPCYGCIIVFSRGSGGHVGFLAGDNGDYWAVLGGNQNDSVCYANIAKARTLATRWPSVRPIMNLPFDSIKVAGVTKNEA
jgi:uncharacterized protein (TIGR02594 family)